MIPTQKSINHHLPASPRHPIIHHQVITSMREIWSPRPPISMSSQSPATGAWAWASLGGGAKKRIACQPIFYFFSRPPREKPRPNLLEIEDSLPIPRAIFVVFFAPPPWKWPRRWEGGAEKKCLWDWTTCSFFFRPPPREAQAQFAGD